MVCSSSVCYSVCMPVQTVLALHGVLHGVLHGALLSMLLGMLLCVLPVPNVLTELPQPVRGHADDTKCVFILITIYPCLMGPNA